MKALLDEMWTPAIAEQLRLRGHDVIAASETDYAGRYAGIPDDELFAKAQEDRRAVVTDNVADYEQARADWESRGQRHHGLIYARDPPFKRHRGVRVIGQTVRALDRFLSSPEAAEEPLNRVHYLRSP